jgi:DNA-binding transcriptional LysR family regulator
METSFLQTFLLVADTGSLAEAARKQNITPAAVAQQVRALERELGAPLVMRSGRTVVPTEAGHRLAGHSRPLVRGIASLRAVVNEEDAVRELRLGTINTALHSVLPETLARFAKTQPQVRVFIHSGTSGELYEGVRQGALDVAVCLHPPFALPKTVAWELLRQEPLVLLAPRRLARRDPHELLRTLPLVRYDRSLGGGKEADRYLRKAGIVPQERFELSSLAAIAMMVERGLGVSVVPDTASPLSAGLQVARIALPLPFTPRRFGLLWQRASVRLKVIAALLAQARLSISQ